MCRGFRSGTEAALDRVVMKRLLMSLLVLLTMTTAARAYDSSFDDELPPRPPMAPDPPRRMNAAGLIVTPAGAGLMVAGSGLLAAWLIESLPRGDCFPPDRPSACTRGRDLAELSISGGVLLLTGAITTTVGVLMLTAQPRKTRPTRPRLALSPIGVVGTF